MQPSTAKLGQVCFVLPYVSKTAGCMINMWHLRFWWTFLEQYDGLCFREFRLQEKLTNLENENHVLRQKAFNMPTMNNLSVAPKTLSEVTFLCYPFPIQCSFLLTPLLTTTILLQYSLFDVKLSYNIFLV